MRGHVLRAVVEAEVAVEPARGKPPAGAAAFVEHRGPESGVLQRAGAGEAGHAGADDGDAG